MFAGCILSAIVTLDSIEIYNTHELLKKPTVYFKCKGDQNKTVLPDVKDKKVLYKFNGEESWQVRIIISIFIITYMYPSLNL